MTKLNVLREPQTDISSTLTGYRKYGFLEEWKFDEGMPYMQDKTCMYIKNELYDMFQYFLNYLRAKQIKFIAFPLEHYAEVTGESLRNQQTGTLVDGTTFMLDESQNIWNICVHQCIKDKYDLMVFGHEVAHVLFNHRVRQENGAAHNKVNYKYEYEADKWACETMQFFGYFTLEQKLKLIELSQLDFMVNTKLITKKIYRKITNSPKFKSYNRTKKGLLTEELSELITSGITSKKISAMLPKMLGVEYKWAKERKQERHCSPLEHFS